jgi:hypothetical protein
MKRWKNTKKLLANILFLILLRLEIFSISKTDLHEISEILLKCGNKIPLSIIRGCHRERGWNQQIMMLENGRLYHSMYLGIL